MARIVPIILILWQLVVQLGALLEYSMLGRDIFSRPSIEIELAKNCPTAHGSPCMSSKSIEWALVNIR